MAALPPRPDELSAQPVTVSKWLGGNLHLHLVPTPVLTVSTEGAEEAAWLLALSELQRWAGWLPLHAATVARGGQAVSITGVSGAGKSTAALRLLGAGWTVLAEDQTWVHPTSLSVIGLDRFLRTYTDSLERFAPQLATQVQGQDAYGKQMLPLSAPSGPNHLRGLLMFGLPERIPAAAVVRAVWECTGVPLLPATRSVSAQAVGQLLRGLTVRGTTRDEVLAQVEKLLASSEPALST